MKNRLNHIALLCLVVLAGMAPVAAHAQYGVPAPAVELRTPPRWVAVPGTNVLVLRQDMRPAYDMFNVGSRIYIYDHDAWYSSDTWNGRFDSIDERAVPQAIRDVPEDQWQNYPSAWMANDNRRYDNRRYDNRR